MSVGSTRPSALISRVTLAAVATSGLLALTGATGCDTVARISFQSREFQSVEPIGFTSVAGSCDGSEGALRFRSVFIASDNGPIRPGDTIASQEVAPAEEDFSFQSGDLYQLPDVSCSTGDNPVSCNTPFECGIASTASGQNRCVTNATVATTGDPTFLSDLEGPQLFGVLLENAASLDGFLPSGVGELSYDFDEDGIAESELDQNQRPGRETDPQRTRKQAITAMFTNWQLAQNIALQDNRDTSFGLWTFSGPGGEASLNSVVEDLAPSGLPFTESREIAGDARSQYVGSVNAERQRANVYDAMIRVLGEYNQADYQNHEKTLVVFVDGPDDLRLTSATAQDVIDAAGDVRVIIVHLDPSLDLETPNGTPLFRDDPDYWLETRQSPCADDSECFNYEECRQPTGYAQTPNNPVVSERDFTQTYCLPKRNETDGRIGPIDAYAEIACATSGGYIYVPGADALSSRMSPLPFVMDGLWELPVSLDELSLGDIASDSGYKLATDVTVTIGGTSQPYSFSEGANASEDTRAVIFSKP